MSNVLTRLVILRDLFEKPRWPLDPLAGNVTFDGQGMQEMLQLLNDAIDEIKMARENLTLPGFVKMPTNADEATAMALLGESWLRHNAPERLKP